MKDELVETVRVEMIDYFFEGKYIETHLPEHIMDRLAGIAISYKILSRDRVTKAAKEQRSLFKGVLYGLELAGKIPPAAQDTLYTFFMED